MDGFFLFLESLLETCDFIYQNLSALQSMCTFTLDYILPYSDIITFSILKTSNHSRELNSRDYKSKFPSQKHHGLPQKA